MNHDMILKMLEGQTLSDMIEIDPEFPDAIITSGEEEHIDRYMVVTKGVTKGEVFIDGFRRTPVAALELLEKFEDEHWVFFGIFDLEEGEKLPVKKGYWIDPE